MRVKIFIAICAIALSFMTLLPCWCGWSSRGCCSRRSSCGSAGRGHHWRGGGRHHHGHKGVVEAVGGVAAVHGAVCLGGAVTAHGAGGAAAHLVAHVRQLHQLTAVVAGRTHAGVLVHVHGVTVRVITHE